MYDILIKEYLKKLSLNDINNFANQNGTPLNPGEDKVIYNFIMNNWKEVYKGDANKALGKLKGQVSPNTYNNIINLYNQYKGMIK